MEIKPAYGIGELAASGPLRRSSLYKAIKEKRLIAQKAGRRTIVTLENYQAFLKGLPIVGTTDDGALSAATPSTPAGGAECHDRDPPALPGRIR
jgi:hypothetical protein